MGQKEKHNKQYLHQAVQEAAFYRDLPRDASLWQKIKAWSIDPPSEKQIHRTNLATCIFLVLGFLGIFYAMGFFSKDPPGIYPGEIDISGTWKINFSDSTKFSDPTLNDNSWCLTGVPNPQIEITKKLNDTPAASCPTEKYPSEKMRNNTYWYRKQIRIDADKKWKDPSIFLGAIKNKAWVYLDGELIAIKHVDEGTGETIANLEQHQIKAGLHILAVRVQSAGNKYPGIFHAAKRKMSIGEYVNNIQQVRQTSINEFTKPALSFFCQFVALLIILALLAKGKGTNTNFYWLSIFFAATSLYAFRALAPSIFMLPIRLVAEVAASVSMMGFCVSYHSWLKPHMHIWKKIFSFSILILSSTYIYIYINGGDLNSTVPKNISLAACFFPYLTLIFSLIHNFASKTKLPSSQSQIITTSTLFFLHSFLFLKEYFLSSIPIQTYSTFVLCSLTVVVLFSAIHEYTKQERILAFYGRFIRPGLKQLLSTEIEKSTGDIKVFRGRQIPIMKIDIMDHTKTTYQMPFGIKRLFQDLWFSVIDYVVHDKVFLDKNVGDGSIYCFKEGTGSDCTQALEAAIKIKAEQLAGFDKIFKNKLEDLLNATPELQKPAESYFKKFEEKFGFHFWERKTNARIALVYGYVDEGLWGLSSQSHYDVQGDLVSLAARIESQAKPDEILLDENFVAALKRENYIGVSKLEYRMVDLKGMGQVRVAGLRLEKTKAAKNAA